MLCCVLLFFRVRITFCGFQFLFFFFVFRSLCFTGREIMLHVTACAVVHYSLSSFDCNLYLWQPTYVQHPQFSSVYLFFFSSFFFLSPKALLPYIGDGSLWPTTKASGSSSFHLKLDFWVSLRRLSARTGCNCLTSPLLPATHLPTHILAFGNWRHIRIGICTKWKCYRFFFVCVRVPFFRTSIVGSRAIERRKFFVCR